MTFTWVQFMIICPLVFLAGFVDAIAGGGGLISLPAYLIAGLPAHNAIGTNKMSSCMGTTLATWKYAKSGFIPWKQAAFCVVCAFIGSFSGAQLALKVPEGGFKLLMLIILPLTAIYVTKGKALTVEKEPYPFARTTVLSMGAALVIGVYDGFYGPGTGTFLILLLTAVAHMNLQEANGVTKAINLCTNISALAVYLINGKTIAPLGFIAGLFGVAGNYLGAASFTKGGARSMKPVMIGVLTVFFVKVLLELLGIL